jgi:erythritol transport system ATP-binding protein
LLGAGRSELFESLFGLRPEASGSVVLGGEELGGLATAERIRRGLFLVPEDRQRDGLVPNLSVGRNLSLAAIHRLTRFGAVNLARESAEVLRLMRELQIKADTPDREITALSGGNQQKVVIGKSLMTNPRVLLLDEPTRGIDVGAKAEVFRIMRELSDRGLGVVFSTSDLMEVTGNADRILVMSRGSITADVPAAEATEEGLVRASTAKITMAAGSAPAPVE